MGVKFYRVGVVRFSSILFVLIFALASRVDAVSAQEPEWGPWRIILPFEHPEGEQRVSPAHSPEEDLSQMRLDGDGPDLSREHEGKGGHTVRWLALQPDSEPSADLTTEKILFAEHFPSDLDSTGLTDKAVAYLYRCVRSDQAVAVPVMFGSDDACRVWLNGRLVHEVNGSRKVSTKTRLELPLEAGRNHLLVKVANGGGSWAFQMLPQLALTPARRSELQVEINTAIDRGVEYLLKTQQLDGSWGYSAAGYRNGQTSLSLYALLKSGVEVEHQAIRRGLEYLRLQAPKKTYSTAVQIMALATARRPQDEDWIKQLAEQMLDWQQEDFAYPDGVRDLSCTQYGAFAYWVASQLGVKIPKSAWSDLAHSVLKYDTYPDGFSYRPGEQATGSMTVAGLTVLSVCKQALPKGKYPHQWRKELEAAERNGMRWLAEHFEPDQNPAPDEGKRTRWTYYYLYGIERLAALRKTDRFGSHDWYWEGADFLIDVQGDEGQWATKFGEAEPNTAFALLFLNRATASSSGPGASRAQGRHYATDGEGALLVLRAKGEQPMTLWLSSVSPELLETHGRTTKDGTGLFLDAVEYWVDGASIGRIEADSGRPWSNEPYALQHRFASRGDHEVQLKLYFAKLAGDLPEPVLSPVLKVRVDSEIEPWMLEYAKAGEWNLAPGAVDKADSSSQRGGAKNKSHTAIKAFDGLQSTAWMSAADDRGPVLRVSFKKPIRCDRIVFSHITGAELQAGDYDLATELEVTLNGRSDSITLQLEPVETTKSTLVLERPSKVSDLTVRVLERSSGTKHKGIVGFAEIELQLASSQGRKRKR